MCGLTGFARHPKGANLDTAWEIFQTMMLQIRHRGTHATGIAVKQSTDGFIWKKAAPVDKVLNSDPWKDVASKIHDDVTVVQGHVRFATHNNAHLDEAAHPFIEGKIVGCHNGIIRNWKEVAEKELKRKDMINDSQVPFALLNEYKNPAKALDSLDGYWALTWTKGASLFLCKTNDASLACAYVPSLKALFWNSEARILRATLIDAGFAGTDFEIWDVKPSTIYRYTPQNFTEKGTNGEKVDAPFRGRFIRQNEKYDSAHSTITTVTGTSTSVANYHGQREFANGGGWDGVNAREIEPRRKPKELSAGQITLKDLNAKFEDMMADAWRTIDELSGRVEVAEAEIEFLRKIMDEKGMLDVEIDVVETDEIVTCPVHGGNTCGCDALTLAQIDKCVTCPACLEPLLKDGEANADLTDGGDCGLIHTSCLFSQGHIDANNNAKTQGDASGVA